MKFLSDRMTSASGSIGGTTFARNRFGMYTRARSMPVNPNTAFQQARRAAMGTAAAYWSVITDAQRSAWDAYAAGSPTTNSLGQTVYLTGAQQFVACNALSAALGGTAYAFTDAPLNFGKAPLGTITLTLSAATGSTLTGVDAGLASGKLAIALGDAVSAGVSFFKGPYQIRRSGVYAAGGLAAAATTGRNGVPLVEGNRVPYRVFGQTSDGQPSTVAEGIAVVAA